MGQLGVTELGDHAIAIFRVPLSVLSFTGSLGRTASFCPLEPCAEGALELPSDSVTCRLSQLPRHVLGVGCPLLAR